MAGKLVLLAAGGVLLAVLAVWGLVAFPAGLAVAWWTVTGGFRWPPALAEGFWWRIPAGIVAGGLVFRLGLLWRRVLSESAGKFGL